MSDEKLYLLQFINFDDECEENYERPIIYRTYERILTDIKQRLISQIIQLNIYDCNERKAKKQYENILKKIEKSLKHEELLTIRDSIMNNYEDIEYILHWSVYIYNESELI